MNDSIYTRRSIRKYLDKQVPKELIEQIIGAGRTIGMCTKVKYFPSFCTKKYNK